MIDFGQLLGAKGLGQYIEDFVVLCLNGPILNTCPQQAALEISLVDRASQNLQPRSLDFHPLKQAHIGGSTRQTERIYSVPACFLL